MWLLLSATAAMSSRQLRLGGEWAGWCCAFSATTGVVSRVPERFCSDSMIEWEQVPTGFEECNSETWAEGSPLLRRTVRLLPEDGCNTEDLSGLISRTELTAAADEPSRGAASLDGAAEAGSSLFRCETVFDGLGGERPRERRNAKPYLAERTRVSLLFDSAAGALAADTPVLIWQERQWSADAELQVREDRSRTGIDAAWLSSVIGFSCFGDGKAAKVPPAMPETPSSGFALSLAGGVEVRGGAGALEVALSGDAGTVRLRRSDFDVDAGVCRSEVLLP